MNVTRCVLPDAPIELIDRLAGYYFFSSTAFAKLWESMGGKPVYWVVEGNGRTIAILPGVEFGTKMFRRFQTMPNGCYGQILYNDLAETSREAVSACMISRIRNEKYAKIFINDFHSTCADAPGYNVQGCSTYVVDISSPDWQPPDSKLRQQIHKAEKEGIEIVPFSPTRHISGFMQLVTLHEERRKVKSLYNLPFFETLADSSLKDDRVQWVWCESDNKPVASSIFIREGNSILHWQMYYDESLSHLQATKLIPYWVARESAKKGTMFLNLGASPPEAEGIEQYKSKWGGEVFHYNCYVHKTLLGRFW